MIFSFVDSFDLAAVIHEKEINDPCLSMVLRHIFMMTLALLINSYCNFKLNYI